MNTGRERCDDATLISFIRANKIPLNKDVAGNISKSLEKKISLSNAAEFLTTLKNFNLLK